MWILILFIHVGPMGNTDSVTVTNVEFSGQAACIAAGEQLHNLTDSTYKQSKYICVRK